MKVSSLITAGLVLTLPCSVASIAPEPVTPLAVLQQAPPAAAPPAEIAVRYPTVSERRLQKSMPLRAHKARDPRAAHGIDSEIVDKNLIAISEADARARAVTLARRHQEGALWRSEKSAKSARRRSRKRFSSSRTGLVHYEGGANWTLTTGFEKIDRFYRDHFGRPLPISAMGQSRTHDRLGLDHSDAVDVAVRPDSARGRSLMAFLRRSEIPFIAFRGRISRMSTGPHIHIGRPSPRLLEVKQRAVVKEDDAENG